MCPQHSHILCLIITLDIWGKALIIFMELLMQNLIQKLQWSHITDCVSVTYLVQRAAGTTCVPLCLVCWLQAERGLRLGWSSRQPCCHPRWGSPALGWPYTGPAVRRTSSPQCSLPHSRTLPSDAERTNTIVWHWITPTSTSVDSDQ